MPLVGCGPRFTVSAPAGRHPLAEMVVESYIPFTTHMEENRGRLQVVSGACTALSVSRRAIPCRAVPCRTVRCHLLRVPVAVILFPPGPTTDRPHQNHADDLLCNW